MSSTAADPRLRFRLQERTGSAEPVPVSWGNGQNVADSDSELLRMEQILVRRRKASEL